MLRGAMEAQDRVGLMLNVRKENLHGVLAVLPALKKPTISTLSDSEWVAVNTVIEESEAWRGDSPAEGSSGTRHRRVSAEQGGDVMRILSGAAASKRVESSSDAQLRLRESGAAGAARLLHDVRRNGDRALRKYAAKWDGLARAAI